MKKICVLFLLASVAMIEAQEKIRIYCLYTPSHEVFYRDWFLPTLQDDYEVCAFQFDQQCPEATFMQDGWGKTMSHKINIILRAIEENWGGVFIYSDVDVQFFRPTWPKLSKLIEKYDIVAQRCSERSTNINSGFFICRANENTKRLWTGVGELLTRGGSRTPVDPSLNRLLKQQPLCRVKVGYLPVTFFCSELFRPKWPPVGASFRVPVGIVLHHAAWKKSEYKIPQLEYVRRVVEEREGAARAIR